MARFRQLLFFKTTAWYGALVILVLSLAPARVEAGFISSSDALSRERGGDLEKIRSVLESKMVAQRLRELGYTSEEVMERLAKLPDQELHRLAKNLDSLQSGGDFGEFLGFILFLLLVALIVVLILELTGHHVIVTERGRR